MHARASQFGIGRHGVVLVAALACLVISAPAAAAGRFADSSCFTQSGAAASQACEQLAREVSHDIDAVRALGDELERGGRYDDAAATYRIALTMHPDHRNLLQRLIRARGQSRALRELAAPNEAAPTLRPDSTSATPPAIPATPAATPATATAGQKISATTPIAANTAAANTAAANTVAAAPTVATRPSRQPTAVPAEIPASGRSLALVIGNEQYADFTRLRTPAADAQALAAVLDHDYGFEVTVLTNATRYQIVSALSQLRRTATEDDSVLIYYAGHGYLDDATSRGYWLPVDAERDNLANWLSTSDITDVLAGLQARHALILADSCFSGTLLRSDPTVALDERQSLLKKLATHRSRSIMTSGGLEPVSDDGGGQHSIFAAALLGALRDNRQALEAGRLFMQIRERVAAGASQTPQYGPLRNAGHDGGDFIFSRHSTTPH
jgi:uncharacterized caspase-like protein